MSNPSAAPVVTITNEQLKARIAELEGQLKARGTGKLSIKLSDKGGASVYGLGRFPVTLYVSQWDALIGFIPDVQAFIAANRAHMTVKATAATPVAAK